MKALRLALVAALFVWTNGYLIKVPVTPVINKIVPVGWVHIQKLLLPLFENVCEESLDPVVVRLSNEFLSSSVSSDYLEPGAYEEFQSLLMSKSLTPKGEIFSELNTNHLNELKTVYTILINARSFDTFYKAACWARQNLNCGLFIDALYLAVIYRKDTEKIFLAPPYEILPNYFIEKSYILKASSLIRSEQISNFDGIRQEGNSYVLDVNYTTNSVESHDKLAYFHEDIGLNSYYFLTQLRWLINSESNRDIQWGQNLYHLKKQLANRYDLERYSNGLPESEPLNWNEISEFVYDPKLIYSDGNDFTPIDFVNENTTFLTILKNIENNITTATIHMRDGGYNKAEILNHLMEILVIGKNSYENLALQVLCNIGSVKGSYSVLSHYMTIVRDPLFWKLNKKVVEMIDNALQLLPVYNKNQLYFPGVEVVNIDAKKIVTSFESFEIDITDALKTQNSDVNFLIKINQPRLNYKPFSFKMNVSSLVNQHALIKIFIGPKILPGQFIEYKNHFMLLDSFETNLKIGTNLISKTFTDLSNLSKDFISLKTVSKYLLDAEFGLNVVSPPFTQSQYMFPLRLLLPKGTTDGLPLQVFVFIAPFVKANIVGSQTNIESNSDIILSPGYPLDLDIDIQNLFNLPNALVKDIIITHKSDVKTNTYKSETKKDWKSNEYLPTDNEYSKNIPLSARPDYTKRNFDYKSKKEQYGQKRNYPGQFTSRNTNDMNLLNENSYIEKIDEIPQNSNYDVYLNNNENLQSDIDNADKADKINEINAVLPNNDEDYRDTYYVTNENIESEDKPTPALLTMPKKTFYSLYNYIKPFTIQSKDKVFY